MATRSEIAEFLGDITSNGIKYHLQRLQQFGLLRRTGGDRGGSWIVIEDLKYY